MEARSELSTYSTNSEAGAPLHIFIRQQGSGVRLHRSSCKISMMPADLCLHGCRDDPRVGVQQGHGGEDDVERAGEEPEQHGMIFLGLHIVGN